MGIFNFIKTFRMINKASNYVQQHYETINKIKKLCEQVEAGIKFLEDHKDRIQRVIDASKEILEKLKGIVK